MAAISTYLDYNASAPLRPGVSEAVRRGLETPGNPSSVHRTGRVARRLLEESRDAILKIANRAEFRLVFTSGGTEANNLALCGAGQMGITRIIHAGIEHPSVAQSAQKSGLTVETVATGRDGIVDLDEIQERLSSSDTPALVSVMSANNETGVIQPVAAIGDLCRAHGALFHTDAVQVFAKADLDVALESADMVSISAHKFGGPLGIGALLFRSDLHPAASIVGGGQELGYRSGTENLAGVLGFAEAAKQSSADKALGPRLALLRGQLEDGLRNLSSDVVIFGETVNRLPNTTCFGEQGIAAETAVMSLDLAGVAVSAGSACSSGKAARSQVISAMGWDDQLASASIRVSMGWGSQEQDVERFLSAWKEVRGRLLSDGCARASVVAAGKSA